MRACEIKGLLRPARRIRKSPGFHRGFLLHLSVRYCCGAGLGAGA